MATQIINANPSVLNAVRIESTQVLPKIVQAISVGEVLPFNVRQNPQNGQGVLYFQGQLIKASLPEELQVGDKVRAEVSKNGNQIVLKILDVQRPTEAEEVTQTSNLKAAAVQSAQLSQQVASLIKNTEATNLQAPQPFSIPENITTVEGVQKALQDLVTSIGSEDALSDPKTALSKLVNSTNGSLATSLREIATAIREQFSVTPEQQTQQVLTLIRQELVNLVRPEVADLPSAPSNFDQGAIERLIDTLKQADSKISGKRKDAKKLIQNVLRDLGEALKNPEASKNALESALSRLQQSPIMLQLNEKPVVETKGQGDLLQVASRLEQMANTLEAINQLNPLMQALGEPALILFPFLFQGLISHSEVTVDPYPNRGKNGNKKGQKSKDGESYHHIQVSVPLPAMGNIDVDIAYQDKEILVRLNTETEEVAAFLQDQLEHLSTTLRELGFETTELGTTVGPQSDHTPPWSEGLRPGLDTVV